MSVPNQRTIKIYKPPTVPPFLQLENKYWTAAFKNLTRTAFGVYLYLCENQSGYTLEFSPQAIHNELGCAKSTASEAFQELIQKGYIVGNNFYVCGKAAWDAIARTEKLIAENDVTRSDFRGE